MSAPRAVDRSSAQPPYLTILLRRWMALEPDPRAYLQSVVDFNLREARRQITRVRPRFRKLATLHLDAAKQARALLHD